MFDLLHSMDYLHPMKQYQLPEPLENWIEKYLKLSGYSLSKPRDLVQPIMKLSDHYQSETAITPWDKKDLSAAYLAYFFPLNYIRNLKVIDEAKHWNFFKGVDKVIDFGCGPGTLAKALLADTDLDIQQITGVDSDNQVGKFFLDTSRQRTDMSFNLTVPVETSHSTLFAASYTLNELSEIPPSFYQMDNILVIEPSTKKAFHKLAHLRTELIAQGFHIWAPCPHHEICPLTLSKKDWCHDRVHWKQPDWFVQLEKHLPIKNPSMSFSYLLASKHPAHHQSYTRVVSDALVEKGKTRWMICQNSERKFMSFLKRHGEAPRIYRGDRVIVENFERKGEELRIDNSIKTF